MVVERSCCFLIEQRMPQEEDVLQRTEGGKVKSVPGRGQQCKGRACLEVKNSRRPVWLDQRDAE